MVNLQIIAQHIFVKRKTNRNDTSDISLRLPSLSKVNARSEWGPERTSPPLLSINNAVLIYGWLLLEPWVNEGGPEGDGVE